MSDDRTLEANRELTDLVAALRTNLRELHTENEKLAKALAEAPTSLEQRKVEALVAGWVEKIYRDGIEVNNFPGET